MLRLYNVMVIQSVVFALAGLGTLLAPQQLMSFYGITLSPGGVGLARLYGATLMMGAIIYWLARDVKPSDARNALVIGGFAGNVLAILVGSVYALTGIYNTTAWINVLVWLLMAIDFGYFLFVKPGKKHTNK